MPIDVTRDDQAKRLLAVARGDFRAQEFVDLLQQLQAGAWSYGVLMDVRLVHGAPTIDELRPLLLTIKRLQEATGPRGPVAIVAGGAIIYGVACAYAAMAEPRGRVEVFRDRDDAGQWLTGRMGG